MKKYLSLMFVFIMMLGLMTPVLAATSAKNYRVSVSKTTGGTVDGAGSYKKGEMVTLTAKAKTGYEFTGWNKLNGVEVDDATEAEITFKMPGKKVSMKANFTKIPTYKVSVSKNGGGTVDGVGSYKEGTTVTLIAEAKTGYEFTGWSKLNGVEVDDATEAEITFIMPASKVSMTANFKKVPMYKVTVSKTSGGSVEGAGSYKEGATVTLTAEPKSGYEFVGWSNIKGIKIEDKTDEDSITISEEESEPLLNTVTKEIERNEVEKENIESDSEAKNDE